MVRDKQKIKKMLKTEGKVRQNSKQEQHQMKTMKMQKNVKADEKYNKQRK